MSSPQISKRENYDIISNYLSKGQYGLVSHIRIKENGKDYALKTIPITPTNKKVELGECKTEYTMLKENNPNVITAYGSFYDEIHSTFSFSMELYPKTLQTYVNELNLKHNKINFFSFLPIFMDMLHGLHGLYQKKTFHRDLKPENILIDSKGRAFLADLGVSKRFYCSTIEFKVKSKDFQTYAGTPIWMPPELELDTKEESLINKGEKDQSKVDVYSLGLLCLYILDTEEFSLAQARRDFKSETITESYLESFRERVTDLPKEIFYIIRCMISHSPSTRPKISQIYSDILVMFDKQIMNDLYHASMSTENLIKTYMLQAGEYYRILELLDEDKKKLQENAVFKELEDNNSLHKKKLALCLKDDDLIEDNFLRHIGMKLKIYTELENFSLALNNCSKITDMGVMALSHSLINNNSLELLELELWNTNISDQGGIILAESLKNKKLKSLKLGLGETMIGDLSIIQISKLFLNLKNLETLMLSLLNCQNITEVGFKKLFESIGHLDNLNNLKLYLQNENRKLKEEHMDVLGKSLSALKDLKFLDLDLEQSQVTDKEILQLANILKKITMLEELKILLNGSKVSTEGKKQFKEIITSYDSKKIVFFTLNSETD